MKTECQFFIIMNIMQMVCHTKETVNSNGDHVYLKYVHPGESSNLPSTIYYDNLIRLNRIEELSPL